MLRKFQKGLLDKKNVGAYIYMYIHRIITAAPASDGNRDETTAICFPVASHLRPATRG